MARRRAGSRSQDPFNGTTANPIWTRPAGLIVPAGRRGFGDGLVLADLRLQVPGYFSAPDLQAPDLGTLAGQIIR
jgi:hypothetical protein